MINKLIKSSLPDSTLIRAHCLTPPREPIQRNRTPPFQIQIIMSQNKDFLSNLRKNYKFTLPLVISAVGVFFNFIGLCVTQSTFKYSLANPLGMSWYLLFFYFAWCSAIFVAAGYDAMQTYRFLMLALTAVAISYAAPDIHSALIEQSLINSNASAGAGLRAAGLIIYIFPVVR